MLHVREANVLGAVPKKTLMVTLYSAERIKESGFFWNWEPWAGGCRWSRRCTGRVPVDGQDVVPGSERLMGVWY